MRINLIFPLSRGRQGYFAFNETLESAIRENVKSVLFTPKGTRIYRPDYGTNIQRLLFEQQDATLKGKIRIEVETALRRWVKNIKIDSVPIYYKDELKNSPYNYVNIDDHTVFVIIQYTIISSDGVIQIPNQTIGLTFSNIK